MRDIFCVVLKCNYLFNFRLEFKDMVLREIFGGEMEKLTGGWRELQWALGEWGFGACDMFQRSAKLTTKFCLKF